MKKNQNAKAACGNVVERVELLHHVSAIHILKNAYQSMNHNLVV